VYDADDQKHIDDLSKQEFIGEAMFKLADVVTAGKVLTKTLSSSSKLMMYNCLSYRWYFITAQKSCGFVNISGEEVEESKFDITMQMYAKKLDKKDFFGKVHVNKGTIIFIIRPGQYTDTIFDTACFFQYRDTVCALKLPVDMCYSIFKAASLFVLIWSYGLLTYHGYLVLLLRNISIL